MGFRVILMGRALKDLKEIGRRIAQNDFEAAHRFGNLLLDRTLPLADFPR